MASQVHILRRGTPRCYEAMKPLLEQLRGLAISQPGYVSGETLANVNDPGEVLVVSTWATIGQWTDWLNDPKRVALQHDIDALIGTPTLYQVYQNV